MQTPNDSKQTDPVEQTMRKVVIGFIAISLAISLLYLWLDHRRMKQEAAAGSQSVHVEQTTSQ